MLAYPSAFTVRTGAAHWETLLRSRAIETQTYVIGAAAVGQHTQTRISWGHAMVRRLQPTYPGLSGETLITLSLFHVSVDALIWQIVDPWGTVLAQCNDVSHEEPTFCLANVDLDNVQKIRAQMPLDKQRRTDIYPEL